MKIPGSFFLVGPMGSGKSTIGRQLAKTLKKDFFDSDWEIEARTGVDIARIFDQEGETGFRQREQEMIDQLTQKHNIVLATGGGAILAPENRKHLASRGLVIFLHASVKQQLKRTANDSKRPLLQTDNPKARLIELMQEREPLYRETADIIIKTDGNRVRDIIRKIIDQAKRRHPGNRF